MTLARKPISKFNNTAIIARWPTDEEIARLDLSPNTLVFVAARLEGAIVGQIDADGNRFRLDA